jgi:hypothetical protein
LQILRKFVIPNLPAAGGRSEGSAFFAQEHSLTMHLSSFFFI